MNSPCLNCIPPERHPGCHCDAKRAWDERRKLGEEQRRADLDFRQYNADRIISAKKRINT